MMSNFPKPCCQLCKFLFTWTVVNPKLERKMIFKRNILLNISFSVYSAWRKYSMKREARFLDKMINKGRRRSENKTHIPKSTSMNDYARNVLYSPETRRTAVLNTILMEHVCDLAALGKYGQELSEMGVQIVKVKLSPNFHVLFIYWMYLKQIDEERVNKLLPEVAAYLRFELSALRVMGDVPEIRFVQDEQLIAMETLQKILDDLSFFKSIEEEKLKNENKEENGEMKDESNHLVKPDDYAEIELVLSKMWQNVYGLDHTKILQNIVHAKAKHQSMPFEREINSQISQTNAHETLRFDKKMLSKMIFKQAFELRKQRQLNRQLLNTVESEEYVEVEDEDFNVEDFEKYSESCEDAELKRMLLDNDSYQDKVGEPKKME